MRRIIVAAIVGLLAVAVLAVVLVVSSLGRLTKAAIETAGPLVTKTTVTVADVDFRPLRGGLRIAGLAIGNPAGFKTDAALRVGEIAVSLNPRSVFSDRVIVQEIRVDAPEITVEIGAGKTNIGTIQQNVETFLASLPGKSGEPRPAEGPEKQVAIDRVIVENGSIRLSGTLLQGAALPIPLPRVELRDIGKSTRVTTVEAAAEILRRVLGGVLETVTQTGQVLTDTVKGVGEGLRGAAGSVLDGAKGILRRKE